MISAEVVPTHPAGPRNHPPPHSHVPTVDIVIPVLNEAAALEWSVQRLRHELAGIPGIDARLVIVNNGSTDDTRRIASRLSTAYAEVSVIHLAQRGRGRALRTAWLSSSADIVAYMDVDLSTDLAALPQLIALVTQGGADVAIGSRLAAGARVVRSVRRELISRSYNRLLRSALRVSFRDAQCGFKALSADAARFLVPQVQDEGWFFDTELLVRAEQSGLWVVELPVGWTEDTDSRVALVRTAWGDLQGIRRLRAERREPAHSRLLHFAAVGLVSTAAYSVMFIGFERIVATLAANGISLVLSAVLNTELNRRFTFDIRGGSRRLAAHIGGLTSLVVALLMTSAALALVRASAGAHAALALQATAVIAASMVATAARYVLLGRCSVPATGRAQRPTPSSTAALSPPWRRTPRGACVGAGPDRPRSRGARPIRNLNTTQRTLSVLTDAPQQPRSSSNAQGQPGPHRPTETA
jgi:glycosyltransferase involved in cell wall biosynthesis